MAKQLNVFIENKPGRLKSVAEDLYEGRFNIIAFSIHDKGDFGMMKLLVDKPEQAHLMLADKGYACALKEVVAVTIKDEPGTLGKLAAALLSRKVNIADAHGFVITPGKRGICILEVENVKAIRELLEKHGFKVLDEEELAAIS